MIARLLARLKRQVKPAPLLSDVEMSKLHEEIFDEPLSMQRLFQIHDTSMPNRDRTYEWVMDQRMFDRIRRMTMADRVYFEAPPPEAQIHLIGLPIAIEPFAKLAVRERAS